MDSALPHFGTSGGAEQRRHIINSRRCGAKRRGGVGLPCQLWALRGRTRCRFHGGRWHYGTPHVELMLPALRRLQAQRKAAGLPWYGGHPRKIETVVRMAKEAEATAVALLEVLPNPDQVLPPDAKPSDLLKAGLVDALTVGRDIVRRYDPRSGLAERKLVGETAAWIARLGVRVWEADLTARQNTENLSRVIAEVKAAARERERAKKAAAKARREAKEKGAEAP